MQVLARLSVEHFQLRLAPTVQCIEDTGLILRSDTSTFMRRVSPGSEADKPPVAPAAPAERFIGHPIGAVNGRKVMKQSQLNTWLRYFIAEAKDTGVRPGVVFRMRPKWNKHPGGVFDDFWKETKIPRAVERKAKGK